MWPMILAWLLKPRNLAIVIGVVAVLGLGASTLYYKNKANRLAKDLKAIKIAAKIAEDNLKETNDNIDKRIAVIQEESRKREQEEKKKAVEQRKKLEASLSNAKGRIADLEGQTRSREEERKQKEKEIDDLKKKLRLAQEEGEQMKKNPQLGALQEDLRKKEAEIRGLQAILKGKNVELDRIATELEKQKKQKEGLQCLEISVPEDEVRILNEMLSK
jgi:chromosome segregation ATPase